MGTLKYIHSAISYPIGACLLLLVFLFFVANLEFFDPSSSVHTVYGLYGYLSQHYDWNIQDTKRCIPHRLSFQSFKKGDIDLDEDSLTHTLWLHWLWTEAPMR